MVKVGRMEIRKGRGTEIYHIQIGELHMTVYGDCGMLSIHELGQKNLTVRNSGGYKTTEYSNCVYVNAVDDGANPF